MLIVSLQYFHHNKLTVKPSRSFRLEEKNWKSVLRYRAPQVPGTAGLLLTLDIILLTFSDTAVGEIP